MTRTPRKRRVLTTLLVAGLVAATGAGTWWLASGSPKADAASSTTAASSQNVTTAQAATRTMVESKHAACTLGYGKATELAARGEGTVTALPSPGSRVEPGQALYALDNRPVVLLRGAIPAWRDLGPATTPGPDVAQLKTALAELGYEKADTLGTSEKWTKALTQAVKAFQKASGLKQTGTLALGAVEFLPSGVQIEKGAQPLGAKVSAGTVLLSWTSPERQLTCPIAPADRPFVTEGAQVPVQFADGTSATGTVARISPQPAQDDEGKAKLQVRVDVPADQIASQLDGSSARVTLERVLVADALAVPVTALVAFADGGYGVQRKNPSGELEYVPVTTGVFADTWVQVTGGELRAGDEVVVSP